MLRHAVLALAWMPLLTGCGNAPPPPIVEAEGIVFLDGQPLRNVEVRFIPALKNGAEYVAKGVTDKEGKFKLICKGKAGACSGENSVLIMEAEIPARLKGESAQLELIRYMQELGGRPLPERYTNMADNPLTVNVTAEQKEYRLELTR